MKRKSRARPITQGIRMTSEVHDKFATLASGWELNYAETFERLVKQAEHRNNRTAKGEKEHC